MISDIKPILIGGEGEAKLCPLYTLVPTKMFDIPEA